MLAGRQPLHTACGFSSRHNIHRPKKILEKSQETLRKEKSPMSSCVNLRPTEAAATSASGPQLAIGSPFGFRHDVHIRFNFERARFEGIPTNFGSNINIPSNSSINSSPEELLNQQFGVAVRQLPRIAVQGYDERVPAVLAMIRQHFIEKSGFLAPHIFRESPSKADRDQAVRDINRGEFTPEAHDVRVLADLLKVWFRELPVPILHEIPPLEMEPLARQHPAPVTARLVLERLAPVERAVVLWLADLLALVAAHEPQNHMGVDQLAIVIAPNLVRLDCSDPAAAVALSKAAVDLFRAVLRARFEVYQQSQQTDGAAAP